MRAPSRVVWPASVGEPIASPMTRTAAHAVALYAHAARTTRSRSEGRSDIRDRPAPDEQDEVLHEREDTCARYRPREGAESAADDEDSHRNRVREIPEQMLPPGPDEARGRCDRDQDVDRRAVCRAAWDEEWQPGDRERCGSDGRLLQNRRARAEDAREPELELGSGCGGIDHDVRCRNRRISRA